MNLSALGLDQLTAQQGIMLLADVALKSAVLLAATWCASKLLWRSSAAMRHLLWTAALLALPVILVATATLPGVEVLPAWSNWQPSPAVSQAAPVQPQNAVTPVHPSTLKMGSDPIYVATSQTTGLSGWQWLWIIYGFGAAAALLPIALGWLSVSWLSRRADRVCSQTMTSGLQQAKYMLGLRRHVELLHSAHRPVPMTWGIISPKVLLPSDAWQWSADRRLAVLLHELAHVKRYDCLTRTLTQIICAMFWFNPLAWVAARRMNLECEQACDDMVLGAGQSGRSYAEHLLDIASNLQSNLLAAHHAIAMARPSTLERRLLGVLDPRKNRATVSSALAVMVVIMAAVIAVPVAMLQAESPQVPVTVSDEVAQIVEQAVATISTSTETDPRIKTAMDSLKPLDKQQTVQAVTKHLDDAEVNRRRAAIYILWMGEFDNIEVAVPKLTQLTDGSGESAAGMAALALGQKKVINQYDHLAYLTLHHDSDYVRRCAAYALGTLGDQRAADVLKQALNDKDPLVVGNAQVALKMLAQVGSTVDHAVDVISTCAENDPRVQPALDSLRPLNQQEVAEALVKHLDDSEANARRAAIFIFWKCEFTDIDPAVPKLMQLTHHPEQFTAGLAALALGQHKVAASYDRLADMTLHHDSAYARRCAAIALGWLGDKRAIDVLTQVPKDEDPLVVANAQAALKMLQGE